MRSCSRRPRRSRFPGADEGLPVTHARRRVESIEVASTRDVDGRVPRLRVGGQGGRSHDPPDVLAVAVVPDLLIVDGVLPQKLTGRLLQGIEVTRLGADEDHSVRHSGAGGEAALRLVLPGGREFPEPPGGLEVPGVAQRDCGRPGRRRQMVRREQVGGPVLIRNDRGQVPVRGRRPRHRAGPRLRRPGRR
jgi:hypothetical protein